MYRVRHEINHKAPEPRLPPFTAVRWHTPRRSLFTTTQTHTPPTRTSPGLGRGSCLSLVGLFASPRRCRRAARAGWGESSCPPPLRGRGRTAPPLRGGSLPTGSPMACSWTSSMARLYKIFGRNLKLGSFLKSRSRAGYICFMSLHAEV